MNVLQGGSALQTVAKVDKKLLGPGASPSVEVVGIFVEDSTSCYVSQCCIVMIVSIHLRGVGNNAPLEHPLVNSFCTLVYVSVPHESLVAHLPAQKRISTLDLDRELEDE